jgi:hypothetical protein
LKPNMLMLKKNRKHISLLLCQLLYLHFLVTAAPVTNIRDTVRTSTARQAIAYLNTMKQLDSSKHWPNIDPALLWQNLNTSIRGPLKSFEGKNTNFCAYTALSYINLRNDPLGFAKFIIELYKNGQAKMGRAIIKPNKAVRMEAGRMIYKGDLDINHLGQLWFLSLADRFKGYLNVLNKKFDEGDENTLWAATNFSKFNHMLRKLFAYKVTARGSDLIRPKVKDIYDYLHTRLQRGTVFLYLNNRLLYKKNHTKNKIGIPTHYVVLTDIVKEADGRLTIIYWDAGRKTLQQVTPELLDKIIFGITYCSNPYIDATEE